MPPQATDPRFGEAALFRDPYAVLSEIAGAPPRMVEMGASLDANQKDGLKGGQAYKDPFDPVYWPMTPAAPMEKKALGSKDIGGFPFDEDAAAVSEGRGPRPSEGKPDATAPPVQSSDSAKGAAPRPDQQEAIKPPGGFSDDPSRDNPGVKRPPAQQAENEAAPNEAIKLQAAITTALASLGPARPIAEVRESNEGLLINLTDDVNYGMFASGSAEPTPGLVRALDKITPLISQSHGQVIVRGHTDNRAYRSAEYDNWRLSTARAHMAYYMLIRGGLDAGRIEHIEGYADRRPKNPSDPSAAQNRRIELLIRAPLP
jgi:chemotaxis protein MotB